MESVVLLFALLRNITVFNNAKCQLANDSDLQNFPITNATSCSAASFYSLKTGFKKFVQLSVKEETKKRTRGNFANNIVVAEE